ncbi:hypothetical protein [Delftia sp. WSY_7]|uniref:hypothetical protein n=1 Tax=Delftia sp. WSY_7 TaxID=3367202 RepID=UPI003709E1D4
MKKLKSLMQTTVLAMGMAVMGSAFAHGPAKAEHGGIVQVANDVGFELVAEADGATIYLTDHGLPMSSTGISGKITVLQGTQKAEAAIKAAGDNKLRADGVKIASGAKIVAVLDNVEGKTATVRFAVK